jgi:Family of unknown function (DUF5309)
MAVGLISSANPTQPANLNGISFSQAITRLMPNGQAPLFALTALLKDETASNIEHGYFSKTMLFQSMTLNAVVVDGVATTFTVVSSADVTAGDLFLVNGTTATEIVMINTIPSGTSVTVTRGVGSTAAAAISNSTILYHIGNAFEEASTRPSAVSIVAARYTNYTQIFRNSWAVSKTAAQIPQIAGAGFVSESKQDCAAFHAMAIEKALFFGEKFIGTRNGQPLHTMEGLIPRIRSAASGNITTLGATTNWTQLEAALDPVLQTVTDPKGSNIRTMFVGGTTRRVLHAIARLNSTYQITTSETSWGLQLDTRRTPRGTFEVIEHPLFNAFGNASTWAKMAVICDLNAFSLAYLRKTSDASYNMGGALVDNGIDAEGGTLTTELTSVIKNPAAFGLIYNFTAGSAG